MNVLMFIVGCIGSRLALTYLAKNNMTYAKIIAYVSIFISIGFMYLYLTGARKTGAEVIAKDKIIWWNHLRPVHASLLAAFSTTTLIYGSKWAWKILFIDTMLGLGAFMYQYFSMSLL